MIFRRVLNTVFFDDMQKVNSTQLYQIHTIIFDRKSHSVVCTTVCIFGRAKSRSRNQATVVPLSATASAASAVRPVSLSGSHEKTYAARRRRRRHSAATGEVRWQQLRGAWWQLRAPSATRVAAASRGTRRQRRRRGREDLLHTLLL